MKTRTKHSLPTAIGIPLLVTLTGCVLMLAWVDPVKASEVSRQLTSKGFVISQLSNSEVDKAKAGHQNFKLILKGSLVTVDWKDFFNYDIYSSQTNYHVVFSNFVKSSLKEKLSTWLIRV